MTFSVGNEVEAVCDPTRIGMVKALSSPHAGELYYFVFWDGARGTTQVRAADLVLHVVSLSPAESLRHGRLAGKAGERRGVAERSTCEVPATRECFEVRL